MSIYFFMIFEVHYVVLRYDVCHEKYMDLSLRSISGTTSEDTKPKVNGLFLIASLFLSPIVNLVLVKVKRK